MKFKTLVINGKMFKSYAVLKALESYQLGIEVPTQRFFKLSELFYFRLPPPPRQPVLGHPGPSPPACFGSNERGFKPLVTAETGRRAWPMVL